MREWNSLCQALHVKKGRVLTTRPSEIFKNFDFSIVPSFFVPAEPQLAPLPAVPHAAFSPPSPLLRADQLPFHLLLLPLLLVDPFRASRASPERLLLLARMSVPYAAGPSRYKRGPPSALALEPTDSQA